MADYITLAELKNTAELVGFSFADYDAQMAISAASQGIDQYTGRRFSLDADTTSVRYYTPRELRYVNVDDIVSVATVSVDYDGDGVFETVWALNTDYVLEPLNAAADGWPYETIRVHPRSRQWLPQYPRSVKVQAQFGWPVAAPQNIKEATTILATRLLRRAREAPFGVVGLGIDSTGVRISRTDPDVCFLLDNWIRGAQVLAA